MASFESRLKNIKGLVVGYKNGSGKVLQFYEKQNKVLIQLDEGTEYSIGYDKIKIDYVSDGFDKVVVSLNEIYEIKKIAPAEETKGDKTTNSSGETL